MMSEPATDKQRKFIGDLLDQRAIHPEAAALITKELDEGRTRKRASEIIDWLLKLPYKMPDIKAISPAESLPDVAAGRYAVVYPVADGVLKFYRVDRPKDGKYAGRTFVKVQASEIWYPIKDSTHRREILELIAADPKGAMARYGIELGHCGHCGLTLTDALSRSIGIGPVCRKKLKW